MNRSLFLLLAPLLGASVPFIHLSGQDLPGSPLPGTPVETPATPAPGSTPPGAPDLPPPPGSGGEEEKPKEVDAATKQALIDTIKNNLYACDKRDVNLVMSTIHPESPTLESTRDMLRYIFARLRLRYTLQQVEVLEVDGDEAEVRVIQATQKVAGNAAFRDNQVELIHTLKRDAQKWKLYSSKCVFIRYFNATSP